jgi:multidrug resistance efflux pump
MTEREAQPIETPMTQKLVDFRHRTLPLVVWSFCALLAVIMLIGRASRSEYLGLAQALEYPVSPVATGTLETVVVDIYDDVRSGDMVAKFDDSPVLASISTANATLRQLQAELEAARVQLMAEGGQGRANWVADLRRFQIDEEQGRLDWLSQKVVVETQQIELERLDIEERRGKELFQAGVIAQNYYDMIRLQRDEVRQGLEDNQVLLAQTEQEFLAAQRRREQYQEGLPQDAWIESMLQPLHEAIEVESRRLDEIELQRQALVLRSPVDGQVSQVLGRRGQSVMRGEPVVVIAEESVREIVAFLAEDDGRDIVANTSVLVSTRVAGGTVAESVVLRVGPTVQELPQRLWRNPRVPDYGRAVVIAAAPSMQLTPGEIVNVKFTPER